MSGEIDITAGYEFDEQNGEAITLTKLNQMVQEMIARIAAGGVGSRELADGSITSDKLDTDIQAQLGVADGSITTAKLVDNCLEDSATGRGKMEDGFLSADAAGRAKMEDGYVTAAKCSPGDFIADRANKQAVSAYVSSDIAVDQDDTIIYDTEEWDPEGVYDHTTGIYTPTVAGVYLIIAKLATNNATFLVPMLNYDGDNVDYGTRSQFEVGSFIHYSTLVAQLYMDGVKSAKIVADVGPDTGVTLDSRSHTTLYHCRFQAHLMFTA